MLSPAISKNLRCAKLRPSKGTMESTRMGPTTPLIENINTVIFACPCPPNHGFRGVKMSCLHSRGSNSPVLTWLSIRGTPHRGQPFVLLTHHGFFCQSNRVVPGKRSPPLRAPLNLHFHFFLIQHTYTICQKSTGNVFGFLVLLFSPLFTAAYFTMLVNN